MSQNTPRPEHQSNPWRTLTYNIRYENPWITVTHYDVLKPNGEPGIYGTVRFKHLAIGILVLDDEMNTWLVGQYRYPLGRYSWEIPEGGGDMTEDPLASAQRELREEAGIEAKSWRLIQRMDLSNSVTDEQAYIFLARGLSFGEADPEDTEELQLRKLPFDEVVALVDEGVITDAISVAAVLRVQALRAAGQL